MVVIHFCIIAHKYLMAEVVGKKNNKKNEKKEEKKITLMGGGEGVGR